MGIKGKAKVKAEKVRKVLRQVIAELQPAKEHFLTANRELLLAIRSAIDSEIKLVEKMAKKKGEKKAG